MGNDDAAGAAAIVIGLLIYFVVLGVPIMQIIHKAGYSRAWVLLLLVPLVNLVMLWIFAFSRWPAVAAAQGQGAYAYGGPPGYPPPGYPPQQYQGGQHPPQPPYQQPPR